MAEGHHEHIGHSGKKVGLLIAVLALVLAVAETAAKSAQTDSLGKNVEASNLWSFFQAKTIRGTVLGAQAEGLEASTATAEPAVREAVAKRAADWRATVARYNDEPGVDGKPGEGRKQLSARAIEAEKARDKALDRYHAYELASAACQVGIVLASASVITGVVLLAFAGGALGLVGVALGLMGYLAPGLLHF